MVAYQLVKLKNTLELNVNNEYVIQTPTGSITVLPNTLYVLELNNDFPFITLNGTNPITVPMYKYEDYFDIVVFDIPTTNINTVKRIINGINIEGMDTMTYLKLINDVLETIG